MNITEFITMMAQDNETQSQPKKDLYHDVIDCMRVVALQNDADGEVNNSKTCEGAFSEIQKYAQSRKSNSTGIFAAMDIVAKYLGLRFDKEKLMAPVTELKPKRGVRNLEDFL